MGASQSSLMEHIVCLFNLVFEAAGHPLYMFSKIETNKRRSKDNRKLEGGDWGEGGYQGEQSSARIDLRRGLWELIVGHQ